MFDTCAQLDDLTERRGPVLWWRPGRNIARPVGARVGWGEDPSRSLTFAWMTDQPVALPVMDIGHDDRFGLTLEAETALVPGWGTRYHHVTVDGLEPDTVYRWRCRHRGGSSPTWSVRTAPRHAAPFTFAAFGDQGVDLCADAVLRVLRAAAPAFTLALGDFCYADPSGGVLMTGDVDHASWDRWLRMLARATGSGAGLLPVVGNHEIESGMGDWGYRGFLARLGAAGRPGPLPTAWSGRWGNVGLVALDANDVSTEIIRNNGISSGRQDLWLEAVLCGLRYEPGIDWIVVAFHQSAYSSNTLHGSDAGVRRWAPLFDRYEVDLVLNGHNHCYERTHPLRGGEVIDELRSGDSVRAGGPVYACAGGGGTRTFPMAPVPTSTLTLDDGTRVPEAAHWSAFRYNGHSLALVDVTPSDEGGTTSLRLRALDANGVELERFTLLRNRKEQ